MLVISETSPETALPALENTAITIGVFDGMHRGHTAVIAELLRVKTTGGRARSIVLTFENHPLEVTHPEMVPPLLTTLDEKLHILEGLNVDVAIVERFTRAIAATDYRAFVERELVSRLGVKDLVVGYDFRLGAGREGSQERLLAEGKRLGFGVTVVPPIVFGGSVISSTRIRTMILERKLERAGRFLGRPYFFEAKVVRGEGVGRDLGFPTANLEVGDPRKLLPPAGVYAVEVDAAGARRGGMMNVGFSPTVRAGGARRIEVHLFDFSGELYGESVRTHCLRYLREERRFASREELRAQLMLDRDITCRILEKKH
jgi:riboflavin kinase/FMN adenylyltransferase